MQNRDALAPASPAPQHSQALQCWTVQLHTETSLSARPQTPIPNRGHSSQACLDTDLPHAECSSFISPGSLSSPCFLCTLRRSLHKAEQHYVLVTDSLRVATQTRMPQQSLLDDMSTLYGCQQLVKKETHVHLLRQMPDTGQHCSGVVPSFPCATPHEDARPHAAGENLMCCSGSHAKHAIMMISRPSRPTLHTLSRCRYEKAFVKSSNSTLIVAADASVCT